MPGPEGPGIVVIACCLLDQGSEESPLAKLDAPGILDNPLCKAERPLVSWEGAGKELLLGSVGTL